MTATLTGDDLVIAYNADSDVLAEISSDGTYYTVTGTDLAPTTFAVADVKGRVTVTDLYSQPNQAFRVKAGTALASPLQVDSSIESFTLTGGITATKVGDVIIGSAGILLANDISTSATNGGISLAGNVDLTANTTLNAGSGAIGFGGTVNGGFSLTINSTGATTFGGAVGGSAALVSLTTNAGGSVSLKSVTTTGGQTYNDDTVTLDGTYTTTNSAFAIDKATTLAGATTVSTGSGTIRFGGTVNGGSSLTANSTGATTFGGTVGGGTPLASLTTNAGGSVSLRSVTTTGGQTYNDAVVLPVDTTLTSNNNGAIAFNSTVDSFDSNYRALAVNTGGSVQFGDGGADYVGNTQRLLSLTTDTGGSTQVWISPSSDATPSIRTQNNQVYNDAVVLRADTTLTSDNKGTIAFKNTVDSYDANYRALTVNTAGSTEFGDGGADYVGNTQRLLSLTTDAGGSTQVWISPSSDATASIRTQNGQTYSDAVTLNANAVFTANNGAITFASTLDGAKLATFAAGTGAVEFKGAVGSTQALAGITLTSAGSTMADSSIKLAKSADSGADGLTVAAGVNNVKMTAAGSSISGFAGNGVAFLGGSTNSQLGGFTVSGNAGNGMSFAAGSYLGTTIASNTITNNGDTAAFTGNGILVQGSDLTIGWDAKPASASGQNVISNNALNGIEITGSGAVGNTILSNSIFLNGQGLTQVVDGNTVLVGEGIALTAGGNGAQVAPTIYDVVRDSKNGKVHVQLTVPAAGSYLVQLFASNATDEQGIFPVDVNGFQGRKFVGASPSGSPAPVGTGKPIISGTPVAGNTLVAIEVDASLVAAGDWITATATLLDGTTPTNTSGFSAGVQALAGQTFAAGGDGQAPKWLAAPTVAGQLTNRYVNELAYRTINTNTIEIPVAGQLTLAQLTTYTNRNSAGRVVRAGAPSLASGPGTEITLAPNDKANAFGTVKAVTRIGNSAMHLTLSGVSLIPNATGFVVLGTPSLPGARLYDGTAFAMPFTIAANGKQLTVAGDQTTRFAVGQSISLQPLTPSTRPEVVRSITAVTISGGQTLVTLNAKIDATTTGGTLRSPVVSVGPATSPTSSSHYDMVEALTDSTMLGIGGKGAATPAQAQAFVTRFQGGMRVASADVNGDGYVDLVTAPGDAGQGFNSKVFGDAPRIITIYNGNPNGTWQWSSINVSGETGLASYAGGFQVSLANLRPENSGSGNAVAELVVASANKVFVYEMAATSRGAKPIIDPVAKSVITTVGSVTGLATGAFTDPVYADIIVATTTAGPTQVSQWLASADDASQSLNRPASVSVYSAAANFARTSKFDLGANLFNGARQQNVFIGGASLAVGDVDNAPDQKPELILGAGFMGMGNFRVLANEVVVTGNQSTIDAALSSPLGFGRAPRGLGKASFNGNPVTPWQPTGGPDFFVTNKPAAEENLFQPVDGITVAPTGAGFNAPLSVAAVQTGGDFKARVFAALGATNGTKGTVRAFTWLSAGQWIGEKVVDVEDGVGTQKGRLLRGNGLRLG